jgi:hypothetical protein
MAHFAELDNNNVVLRVIVVGNDDCKDSDGNESEAVGIAFCQSLFGSDTYWVQTSYNNNIRYRYAGIGSTYDQDSDVFIPPQPYPSWILNTDTWDWDAPVPIPDDGGFHEDTNTLIAYFWNEETISWDKEETVVVLTGEPNA